MEIQPPKQKTSLTKRRLASIGFELSYIIALPVVILGLSGKWLDGKIGTMPLFTMIGIFLAMVSTSVWIYRQFKTYV